MAAIDDSGFFGHPKGLRVLFFSEMWERFSYYGMRALLVLYMIAGFDYTKKESYAIYGAYTSLVYACPVIGGWIANSWIGYRNSIILGAVLMALGHFAMALQNETFFFMAMALLCVGNGFFKPNISSTVGRLYKPGDPRRDRGFTIFYMAINIGALMSPIVCGNLGEKVGWHYGFAAAGVGMVIGLVWFIAGQKHIGHHGDPDDHDVCYKPVVGPLNRLSLVWIGALMIVPAATYALMKPEVAAWFIYIVGAGVLLYMVGFVLSLQGRARLRLIALMMLMGFHMLFWAGFEQAGSSFSVLTKMHVDRELFGITFEASLFQSVNPAFIVLLAPLFALLWRVLHKKKRNPSIPVKFGLGLLQLGLGFWVLTIGLTRTELNAEGVAIMGLGWLILTYFFHTTGELWLSPIGLSAVTKLAPKKWVGFCMGAWFLTISFGSFLGGKIAQWTASEGGETLTGMAAIEGYSDVFTQVAISAAVAGLVLLALSPYIKRLISEETMGDDQDSDLPKAKAKISE